MKFLNKSIACLTLLGLFGWTSAIASSPMPRSQTGAQQSCREIDGASSLSAYKGVIFVGEHHGTNEMPEYFGRLACTALANKKKVHLAFELPVTWSAPLAEYLRSGNDTQALKTFLEKTQWRKFVLASPDGRTSRAMLALFQYIRTLARAGLPVSVSTFDTRPWESPLNSDVGMAAALTQQIEQADADVTLVLSGELHTRPLEKTNEWQPQPMAFLVAGARPTWNLLSFVVTYSTGTIWLCGPANKCGSATQPTDLPVQAAKLSLFPAKNPEGYAGQLYVGSVSASEPFTNFSN